MSTWQVTGEKTYPAGSNPMGNDFYGYRQSEILLPDGRKANYHGILVGSCVHVVAVEDDLTTYLVFQHRPNARAVGSSDIPKTTELPGGFVTGGLDAQTAANMELGEEIGKNAGKLELLGTPLAYPGVSDEIDHIYLGSDLSDVSNSGLTEATEQDMAFIAEPFGIAYDKVKRQEYPYPVTYQTLAAMGLAADRL